MRHHLLSPRRILGATLLGATAALALATPASACRIPFGGTFPITPVTVQQPVNVQRPVNVQVPINITRSVNIDVQRTVTVQQPVNVAPITQCNNCAPVTVTRTAVVEPARGVAAGGSSLPVTGPRAAITATLALLILSGGTALFLITRKRRLRFVS